jgi:hypothetical protein
MILVGGATRLTDSGLSITEWKPLLGAFPPMNDTDWADAFAKYQSMTAQYHLLNPNMDIAGLQGHLLVGVEPSRTRPGDRRGVRAAADLLLGDGADDEEAVAASADPVRAGRAAGIDRLVDGVVGRELRADVCCALQADDALRAGAADHLLLLLALDGAGRNAKRETPREAFGWTTALIWISGLQMALGALVAGWMRAGVIRTGR